MKKYEIRDPIHGFITFNELERDIINHPAFQRLRRIKQLSLTNMVYPGAQHTRFEHSLGVMHLASRMFDNIVLREGEYLKNELNYNDGGLQRVRELLRLAALLHDIGHAPFSHPAEELMPIKNENNRYDHEDYSAAIIKYIFNEVIDGHPDNCNYNFKAEDIADFFSGKIPKESKDLLWKDLISSQLDADRADYLLRDSYYIGANYGIFDLNRLLVTITIRHSEIKEGYVLGFERGGFHSAEALIIARLMMFTQVYFHKTRRAYDIHIREVLKELYKQETGEECFPEPTSKENIEKYLSWDDWKVNGLIQKGEGGEHAKRILERNHYRKFDETEEIASEEEVEAIYRLHKHLQENDIISEIDESKKSWYKPESEEIILFDKKTGKEKLLNDASHIVKELCEKTGRVRLYIDEKDREKAEELKKEI